MNRLIYIIDDDPIVLLLTTKLLERHSNFIETKQFRNGLEAINKLRVVVENNEKLPDLILLDLNMPVLDGWQFLEAFNLLKTNTDTPIYVVTSSIDSADIEKARTAIPPLKGYIMKPINEQKLLEIQELNN